MDTAEICPKMAETKRIAKHFCDVMTAKVLWPLMAKLLDQRMNKKLCDKIQISLSQSNKRINIPQIAANLKNAKKCSYANTTCLLGAIQIIRDTFL